jgi:hypothetical protein
MTLAHVSSWDLCAGVRLACRRLSSAASAILRQRHLASYLAFVRPPYTTDPLGARLDGTPHVEVQALDRLAAATSLTTRLTDESDLHLFTERDGDRPAWLDDIFGRLQPSLRLTDLLASLLVARGHSETDVGVRLGLRDVALTLPRASSTAGRGVLRREMATAPREAGEALEATAERLVRAYLATVARTEAPFSPSPSRPPVRSTTF